MKPSPSPAVSVDAAKLAGLIASLCGDVSGPCSSSAVCIGVVNGRQVQLRVVDVGLDEDERLPQRSQNLCLRPAKATGDKAKRQDAGEESKVVLAARTLARQCREGFRAGFVAAGAGLAPGTDEPVVFAYWRNASSCRQADQKDGTGLHVDGIRVINKVMRTSAPTVR